MARSRSNHAGRRVSPNEVLPEPERVLHMALESGAIGRVVWEAVAALSSGSDVRAVLDMLKAAPANSWAAELIGQQFASPARLSLLLREDPVDFDAVDALLRHLDITAAEPLLDELVSSSSRATRRGILERLARFGPDLEPLILPRLTDDRWFVLRNMLHVLNEADCSVQGVPLAAYQNHADPRVRREAVQLLLKDAATRDRALAGALRDTDPTIVQTAMKAARAGLPEAAATILAKRIVDPDFPPEFRAPALQLLGRSGAQHALECAAALCAGPGLAGGRCTTAAALGRDAGGTQEPCAQLVARTACPAAARAGGRIQRSDRERSGPRVPDQCPGTG